MKKLLTALCTLITFTMVTVFCFTGCSPVTTSNVSANENDWVEVAEITYYINNNGSNPAQGDNCLEISYWKRTPNYDTGEFEYTEKTIRILPLSYQVTYFND